MAEETVRVDSTEDLDSLIQRLKRSGSKDVVLAVPEDARALQTLDQFNVLRREVKDAGLNVTFMGGNKTTRGLAKILGFPTREGVIPGGNGVAVGAVPAQFGSEPTIPFPIPNGSRPVTNGNGNGAVSSFGPPDGFVVANNGGGQTNPFESPMASRSAQDFLTEMQSFSPNFGGGLNPPPLPANGTNGANSLGRNGDIPLSRNNMNDFFNGIPEEAPPPPRPNPEFSFGGGEESGARPMSIEEARAQGLLGSDLSGPDFAFGEPGVATEEGDIGYADGPDTALGGFQSGVRRRGAPGEAFDDNGAVPAKGRRGGRTARPKRTTGRGPAIALPIGLAGLGNRVKAIIVPVRPQAPGMGGMVRPEIDPATRRKRAATARRTTFITAAVLALLLLLILFFILPNLLNPSPTNVTTVPGTAGSPVAAKVALTMKSQSPQTKNISLLLNTNGSSTSSTASGSTSPGAANQTATAGVTGTGANGTTAGVTGTGANGQTGVGTLDVTTIPNVDGTASGNHPAFGSKTLVQPARGKVTFINYGGGTGFAANAVVYHNSSTGVSYHVVTGVSVPAGNIFANKPGVATVDVVADATSGTNGNLPNGFRVQFGGGFGAESGPITGGQNQVVKAVSDKDLADARKMLTDTARNNALANLQGQINPATQGAVLIQNGDPNCSFDHTVDQVADNGLFNGNCKASFKAYVYAKAALQQAVQQETNLPTGQQIDPSSLKVDSSAAQPNTQNGRVFLTVPTTYSTMPDVNAIKQTIAGKSPQEATSLINSQYGSLVDKVDFPGFSGSTLPSADKMDVSLVNQDGTTIYGTPVASGAASTVTVTTTVGTPTGATPAPITPQTTSGS